MTALAISSLLLAVASAASASVPNGFVGMVVGAPVFSPSGDGVDLAGQLDSMVAGGVETVRVAVDWAQSQPYRSWSQVPAGTRDRFQADSVDEVPTDFSGLDELVGLAAQRGMTVLPTILDAPYWDGTPKTALTRIPRTDGPYANFVEALVRRYGPGGSYWLDHFPQIPIRMWQIWNEPNLTAFWPQQPFARRYVGLLRAARAAVKAADPGAQIVLAGLPNFSWIDLASIYRVKGAGSLFDVVAVHPYTRLPKGVITILGLVRWVMNRHGDSDKPIIADEISWPSSLGKTDHDVGYDFATTEAGQAQNIRRVLPLLVANRKRLNLLGFYYYDWAGQERPNYLAFDFAGLFRLTDGHFVAKPAYTAFRDGVLAMEDCRVKGPMANICLR